jgi:DnaJ-class molecular chaperone
MPHSCTNTLTQVAYEVLRDPQRRRMYDRGQLADR